MNDPFSRIPDGADTENSNPLLKIDTSFRSYLMAYTRSFSGHVVDGVLDYAFDADFSLRQKITGLSGWAKLAKAINSQDVTEEAKLLFLKTNQAGSLKHPEVYEIAKKCAERLELGLPTVFVRDDIDKKIIYSIASDIIEPCIVITEALVQMCERDELQVLIGSECGRIQNHHCTYNFAYKYFNPDKKGFMPVEQSYHQPVSNQLVYTLSQWVRLADVTADRAGMICCDEPERYAEIIAGLYEKGYIDYYGRTMKDLDFERIVNMAQGIHYSAARNIQVDADATDDERRILAAVEFLNCDLLYNWRSELSSEGLNVINGQLCDVRCNLILGTSSAVG